ncbi:MAG: PqqD family protein, partial [Gaiellaceae bacterium]
MIRKNPQVVYRTLAGEGGVLLHLESGAYHGLNEVGTFIWGLLDEEKTFDQLVAELREQLLDARDDRLARALDRLRLVAPRRVGAEDVVD